MSEVQSRPAASRGRGSGRGGRGGYASRGRGPRPTNGDSKAESDSTQLSAEDEGEIGELKKKYGAKAAVLKGPFPDWSDVDILYALQETDGDEALAATRMSEGTSASSRAACSALMLLTSKSPRPRSCAMRVDGNAYTICSSLLRLCVPWSGGFTDSDSWL
jgi:hypothetical protein